MTIALDRGYITYNPVGAKWFSATAGKFAFTWARTSVTFDPDINPEGFVEKFSKDFESTPIVKNVNLQFNAVVVQRKFRYPALSL